MTVTIAGKNKKPAPAAVQSIATEPVVPKKVSELNEILKAIRKEKGDKMVVRACDIPNVERLATGLYEFDDATGGGFPRGRYSIVYGPESSGKSNICYAAAATAQRLPPPCNVVVWVDLESTFDPLWAALFGIDVEKLLVVKPAYGEEAVDMVDALVRAEDVALLVLDSLAVVTSTKELEQSAEKFDVGTAAILVKRLCNKLVIALSQEEKRGHNPAVILINQTRFKIGVMFGDPETMPGGQTMKFLSSLTVRLYGKNKIEKNVHPELPSFKETVAVIKKAKIGIRRSTFNYDMCVLPHGNLGVGESDSWNAVSSRMKDAGILSKSEKGGGWDLFGVHYPTLVPIQDTYYAEKEFASKCQAEVSKVTPSPFFLVAGEGAAA